MTAKVYIEKELNDMKKSNIQSICEERSLKSVGTKQQLIKYILKDQEQRECEMKMYVFFYYKGWCPSAIEEDCAKEISCE